jgi:hypothetical protein
LIDKVRGNCSIGEGGGNGSISKHNGVVTWSLTIFVNKDLFDDDETE